MSKNNTAPIRISDPNRVQALAFCLLAVLLAGCGQRPILEDNPPALKRSEAATPIKREDFSGSWEINYQLSDRVEESVDLLRLIAMAEARRAQDRLERRIPVLPSFELVKLADSISQTTMLEIEQDARQIEIKRGEEFPFSCTFNAAGPREDQFATEYCGWEGHQLVFAFILPDRLNIIHRLTLAPERDRLNVATTVGRRGTAQTFTLNRVYSRFEPLPEPFECRQTVAGTKTCRPIDPPSPESSPR